MTIINNWTKSISKILEASFSLSSSVANHSSILGDARESFIRDILRKFLPANVVIGSGQITDQHDNYSKQIDIIIYRDDFPVLRTFGSSDVYLIEGVIATIEIKSTLKAETLIEALDNCKSVKNLKPTLLSASMNDFSNHVYGYDFLQLDIREKSSITNMLLPPCFIFGYTGLSNKSKLIEIINDWFYNSSNGQQDIQTLPDIISAQGNVAMKNLGNFLHLKKVSDREKQQVIDKIKTPSMTPEQNKIMCKHISSNDFYHGCAIKSDDYPIRYLITELLQSIFSRLGRQKYGATNLQYELTGYLISDDMEGGWSGAAIDFMNVTDPKLDFLNEA